MSRTKRGDSLRVDQTQRPDAVPMDIATGDPDRIAATAKFIAADGSLRFFGYG